MQVAAALTIAGAAGTIWSRWRNHSPGNTEREAALLPVSGQLSDVESADKAEKLLISVLIASAGCGPVSAAFFEAMSGRDIKPGRR